MCYQNIKIKILWNLKKNEWKENEKTKKMKIKMSKVLCTKNCRQYKNLEYPFCREYFKKS